MSESSPAFIPITSWDSEHFEVHPKVEFHPESIDRPADIILEAAKAGKNVELVISTLVEDQLNERVWEGITQVLALVVDSKKPRLTCDQLAWVTAIRLRQGVSMPELAKKHGISKQAFCQGTMRICADLNLKPTRAMRSEIAKQHMREAYIK